MILNAALLQLGWFAAVWGAAHGASWWGPAFCGVVTVGYILRAARPGSLALLVLGVSLLGLASDALLMHLGLLSFPGWELRLPEPWIVSLWPLFATTYDRSFRWLRGRPGLACLLGAVGGPMGYVAADRMGALQLAPELISSVLALAVAWAVLLPTGLALADRLLSSSGRSTARLVPHGGPQR